MRKIWTVAAKDLLVTIRDPSALGMLLVTPFLVALVMTFAFGRSGGSALRDIPLHIVNHDRGEMGTRLVKALRSEELADLLEPTLVEDEAAARAAVDSDRIAAAVIVPAGLSQRITAAAGPLVSDGHDAPLVVEIYANPGREVSASVVRSIVEQVVALANTGAAGVGANLEALLASGRLSPQALVTDGVAIGERIANLDASGDQGVTSAPIRLERETRFDWLAYFAPSLAVVFLTMAMTWRTRSILEEREAGTLPRLRSTPTPVSHFLAGKVAGSLAVGLLQMAILVLATRLLLDVHWGAALPLSLLIAVTVTTMTSLGLLIAALSRTSEQAADYGQMVLILFAALGGHLLPRTLFPGWLRTLGYATPNAWSMEALAQLGQGGGLADIALPLAMLAGMAALFFILSVSALRRQEA